MEVRTLTSFHHHHHLFSVPSPLTTISSRSERLVRFSGRRTGGPAWDPNAETVRSREFGSRGPSVDGGDPWKRERRSWWSDGESGSFDDEDDEYGEDEGLLEKFWIFKVFKSYGYLVPAIIASILLASGPKAFLMALALPLGQSLISLALDKVWGKATTGPRPKTKAKKRRPFYKSPSYVEREEAEEEITNKNSKDGPGYQSWVSSSSERISNNSGRREPGFGGWDELDGRWTSSMGKREKTAGTRARAEKQRPEQEKKERLTRRGRNRDAPFFLRLLIAVFPFLGSWTKLL
ncbi:hypothetical protein QJS10_CPA06g00099 [Acorus calamus]|uniref:Uncharacterized protein n=1 Tax=Acorus calamus TaxID=4465 RepID=A0AAV9EL26_ACOCL|nr:hypothetical protein QJS10_CPA06g00099 [Acorus calamus]